VFFAADHPVRGRRPVKDEPGPGPKNAGPTRQIEDPPPSVRGNDRGKKRRRDDRAHRGTRVEKAESQRTLARRKPFRDRLGRAGKTPALAHPEQKAKHPETKHRSRGADQTIGDRPPNDHDGVADARPKPIHDAPSARVHDCIGEEKQRRELAVLLVADRDVLFDRPDDDREALAIQVVQRRGQGEQAGDPPAKVADDGHVVRGNGKG
jgi:hypothetical protein